MEDHAVGCPQGGGEVFLKCYICCKPVRGPNGRCNWGFQLEEMMGSLVGKESNKFPGLGRGRRHFGVGNSQGKARKQGITKFEVEFLDCLRNYIDSKMEKLKKFMAHAGNFVDLSSEKNGAAGSADIVMYMGLQ